MIDHAPGSACGGLDAFLKWILIVTDTVSHHKKHAAEFG
mgnify:CR=1 FL=1